MVEQNKIIWVIGLIIVVLLISPNLGLFSIPGSSPPTIPMGISGVLIQDNGVPYPIGTEVEFIFRGEPQVIQGGETTFLLDEVGFFSIILLEKKGTLAGREISLFINGEDTGKTIVYQRGGFAMYKIWPNNLNADVSGIIKAEDGKIISTSGYAEVSATSCYLEDFGGPCVNFHLDSYEREGSENGGIVKIVQVQSYNIDDILVGKGSIKFKMAYRETDFYNTPQIDDVTLYSGNNNHNIVVDYSSRGKAEGKWEITPSKISSGIATFYTRNTGQAQLSKKTKCYLNDVLIGENYDFKTAQDHNWYRFFDSGRQGTQIVCPAREIGEIKTEIYHFYKGDWVLDATETLQQTKNYLECTEDVCEGRYFYECQSNELVLKGRVGKCGDSFEDDSICGDDVCESDENIWSCEQDCGYCGDGICANGEGTYFCPQDCDLDYDHSGESVAEGNYIDSDEDGFVDNEEIFYGTNPNNPDSYPVLGSQSSFNFSLDDELFNLGGFEVTWLIVLIALGGLFILKIAK